MEESHGGGACHSLLQSTLSLHLALAGIFSFSFRLEVRGFASDSVKIIFSLYLVTIDIKLPEQMSYPEEEHSISTGEQWLSKVTSVADEHFPVIESAVQKNKKASQK